MTERFLLGGTDGFRGVATEEYGPGLMNQETLRGLTYELVAYQQEQKADGVVIVARDTRPSSAHLSQAVVEGALGRGAEVWDLGVAPTPTAQKIAAQSGAMATVVVTASHNTYTDNGWKGMLGAEKPSSDVVQTLSDRFWDGYQDLRQIPRTIHQAIERPELKDWYLKKLARDIEETFGERPLLDKLIAVDGAFGAAQSLTPRLLRRLGADVVMFSCYGNGNGIINDGCGAADLSGIKSFLADRPELTMHPDFLGAVANDGDADRFMGIGALPSHNGAAPRLVEINGNHAMLALAEKQAGIVGTEYTNSGLVQRLAQQGVEFAYCPNGDVNVTAALRAKQALGEPWTRGGEFTGHLIDTDWLPSGDGVRMAAWMAAYAAASGRTFGDIYQDLPLWSEHMVKIPYEHDSRNRIKQADRIASLLHTADETLGDNGRLIVRASGTEPVVRIWGESNEAYQKRLATIMSNVTLAVQAEAEAS